MLRAGSVIRLLPSGRRGVVARFIGEGSQGSVFEATVDNDPEPCAVKWYFPHTATRAQRDAIADLVERGAPSRRFLWPLEVVEASGEGGFGYLMPLRPPRHVGLSELLTGKTDAPFSVVLKLCIDLADSFLALHSQGLCYRDISFGNVFFDPETGAPLICDNDNVGIDGESPSPVLGTRRFMAPEIVRGEAGPSRRTDLYSLSVLLFYVLMVGHPLVGRRELHFDCWDDKAENELFGRSPLFVFDPTDDSNGPLPDLHGAVLTNWGLYPGPLRGLFTKAFTTGLRDPVNGRVQESVWRRALAQTRDSVRDCPWCGKQNLFDADATVTPCWFCERALDAPLRIVIDGWVVILNEDTRLHGHHLRRDYDFESVVAEVARHPSRPDTWGLRNMSDQPWRVEVPGRPPTTIEPSRSVGLVPGTRIDFGRIAGLICG
jgi:DNA-binding helix-hairpin-helix protein with protein kinase domain